MPALSNHIIIEAPADAVWEVVGHQFGHIGQWATAIPASTTDCSAPSTAGAPVAGRVCQTGIRLISEVTETIVAYDETGRTLTYEATAGTPAFVTKARNRWQVTALDGQRTDVAFEAQVEVRGLLGRAVRWWILAQAGHEGRHILDDLKHYVEHSAPCPRKQQQLSRARR